MKSMKKTLAIILAFTMVLAMTSCKQDKKESTTAKETTTEATTTESTTEATTETTQITTEFPYMDATLSTEERVADLLSRMTLEEKAGQMTQGAIEGVDKETVTEYCLGSVLSGGGGVPGNNSVNSWQSYVSGLQEGALETRLQIPILYGIDAVHGQSNVKDAVIFPHNIGLGAANNPELMYEMGAAVAEEMKLTYTLWNFSPCVANAMDPRWGRTYESFSNDTDTITSLAVAYMNGMQDHGVVVDAKHYCGDGAALWGTGEGSNLIDRGNYTGSEEEFYDLHVTQYAEMIEQGCSIIMASFTSFDKVKMTENYHYLTEVLKEDMGFEGFVVTDWAATDGLGEETYEERIAAAVNAGVDMFMEPYTYAECINAIIYGVENGLISQERIDDAVARILTVKFNMGLFEDPMFENIEHEVDELGSQEYRDLAEELVSQSCVLLKNDNAALPIASGSKVLVMGPACDDIGGQCGGWTITWQGGLDQGSSEWTTGTTILEGFEELAAEAGIEILTDPEQIDEADVVVLCLGETPYAEYSGDSADISITGALAMEGNAEAIEIANTASCPVVTCIIAGRQVMIGDYLGQWDAAVMCYLPGTEGAGIVKNLLGMQDFTGKLPMPWYASVDEIGTSDPELLFDMGYGLTIE